MLCSSPVPKKFCLHGRAKARALTLVFTLQILLKRELTSVVTSLAFPGHPIGRPDGPDRASTGHFAKRPFNFREITLPSSLRLSTLTFLSSSLSPHPAMHKAAAHRATTDAGGTTATARARGGRPLPPHSPFMAAPDALGHRSPGHGSARRTWPPTRTGRRRAGDTGPPALDEAALRNALGVPGEVAAANHGASLSGPRAVATRPRVSVLPQRPWLPSSACCSGGPRASAATSPSTSGPLPSLQHPHGGNSIYLSSLIQST